MKPIPLIRRIMESFCGVSRAIALSATALVAAASFCYAKPVPVSYEYHPCPIDSGVHTNRSDKEIVAFVHTIHTTNHGAFRLHFSSYELGERSYVSLISTRDGGRQRLDARNMKRWNDTSAFFNGPDLQVELHVGPGEQGVYVRADQLIAPCHCANDGMEDASAAIESLCGADNRVAMADFRVGRIGMNCTAWLVSNGAVLTAGHCAPLTGVFEVNVPPSRPNGILVASSPDDQFPIDTDSVQFVAGGMGNDWAVFALLPNSNTGQRAHVAHGFFRVTRESPAEGTTTRVTGYGVDRTPIGTSGTFNAQTQTEQTATGPFVDEVDAGGNAICLRYAVDTTGGNSGGPVIWEANGFAIGIHTNAGCDADGGSNVGTSLDNDALELALQRFPGANTRYVDAVNYPNSRPGTGTIFQPFKTIPLAAATVGSRGRISVVAGSYPASAGNTGTFGADGRSFTLVAPVGTVTIGN